MNGSQLNSTLYEERNYFTNNSDFYSSAFGSKAGKEKF
jgi:hypothetical protein